MTATSQLMVKQLFSVMLVLFAAAAQPLTAQTAQTNIDARLVSEAAMPKPGSTVMLAIDMQPKPGWHGYWKNPGDAGFPADLKWSLPPGAHVGPVRYPVPEPLVIQGLMNHVFNGEHALLVPFTVPANAAAGTELPIRLSANWLACTDKVCVPERAALSLSLRVGEGIVLPQDRARFDRWRVKLPRPLGSSARFDVAGDRLRIAIPLPASIPANGARFFAETEKAVDYAAPQNVIRTGDQLVLELAKTKGDFVALAGLKGVLALEDGSGFEIEAAPGHVAASSDVGLATISLAVGGAFLGGMLLNIMPCVFPVISLKALNLARAGGEAQTARKDAIAYTGGVVLTCLALGGVLLTLRAAGQQVGWAFQLQNPAVILSLFLLVAAICFNLIGGFELRGFGGGEALVHKDGAVGAFWTGALAAFVATPCTGPFMAAALGAALVLPVPAALGIFGGLGLGLAAPFLALGFIPSARKMLPRPGPWMVKFQHWMALPMALTLLALGWLLWRQGGGGLIGLAVVLAFVLLALLRWGARRAGAGLAFTPMLGAVVVASLIALPILPHVARAPAKKSNSANTFNEARLAELRRVGKPVFVYFTADWCVTCKVNEQTAIERKDVQDAFVQKGVTVMVGDWTNGDPAIGRFIESQGRSGVPLYLYYPAGGGAPKILPQILTPSMLIQTES